MVDQIERQLSDRDRAIIDTLAEFRFATGQQLQRLHFTSGTTRSNTRTTNVVLSRLTDLRVVARNPRQVGGVRAGSRAYVYSLDAAGQRIARGGAADGRRPTEPSVAFLDHTLAVTELYVRVREEASTGRFNLTCVEGEPRCWRTFQGIDGGSVTLKPDAAITLTTGPYEDHWFIEVDRSTVSTAALRQKLAVYRGYWATGNEQVRRGVFPRVLWVVDSGRRVTKLLDVLSHQPSESWQLFEVCHFDHAVDRLAEGAA